MPPRARLRLLTVPLSQLLHAIRSQAVALSCQNLSLIAAHITAMPINRWDGNLPKSARQPSYSVSGRWLHACHALVTKHICMRLQWQTSLACNCLGLQCAVRKPLMPAGGSQPVQPLHHLPCRGVMALAAMNPSPACGIGFCGHNLVQTGSLIERRNKVRLRHGTALCAAHRPAHLRCRD